MINSLRILKGRLHDEIKTKQSMNQSSVTYQKRH